MKEHMRMCVLLCECVCVCKLCLVHTLLPATFIGTSCEVSVNEQWTPQLPPAHIGGPLTRSRPRCRSVWSGPATRTDSSTSSSGRRHSSPPLARAGSAAGSGRTGRPWRSPPPRVLGAPAVSAAGPPSFSVSLSRSLCLSSRSLLLNPLMYCCFFLLQFLSFFRPCSSFPPILPLPLFSLLTSNNALVPHSLLLVGVVGVCLCVSVSV